jgi:hypothetical protein
MGTSTSSTQETKPPEWAEPLFKQSAAEATNLYNSGVGGNTYSGSTVAPLSDTTMSGINSLARTGANTNTAGTRPLLAGIGAASTSPSYSEKNLQGLAKGAGQSYAEKNLGAMANGSYLKSGNPYFNDALQGQLDSTASQVQSQFSGAGRYGSGANTGVLTNSLGNIRSGALRDQFNADTSNMLAANSQMDAGRFGGIDRSLAASSQLDSSRNAGLDRALTATGAMGAQDQQQFQNALTGAGATLQAGGLLDKQGQALQNDAVSQWYAQDNAPWTRLGLLQQAAAGSAGDYGTQKGHSSSSNPLGAMGGLLGALPAK